MATADGIVGVADDCCAHGGCDPRYHLQVRRFLPPLALALPPLLLLRETLQPGRFPGTPFGEGWGRLFVNGQVIRWLTGLAPVAESDLLNHPHGLPFWPVDALTHLVMALPTMLAGSSPVADAAALSLTMALLFLATGLGTYLLAREAGARSWASLAAGLAAQLHPFLLRNAEDTVMEVLALGPAALALAAGLRAWRRPSARRSALVAAAAWVTGATSPYYAVYLCLGFAALTPWALLTRAGWRRWLPPAAGLLLGFFLAALPLLLTETSPQGRLGPSYREGGYSLGPARMVLLEPDGEFRPAPKRRGRRQERPGAELAALPPQPPSALRRALIGFPGGAACFVALLAGLCTRRSRPWALAAALFFLLGPGPTLLSRDLGLRLELNLLQELLQLLPLTRSLGNAQRMTMGYALPALVAAAVALRTRGAWSLILAALAALECWCMLPRFSLPSTQVSVDQTILAALYGPTVSFPAGDPPYWSPDAPPKLNLFLASVHGHAVAGDYGRGRLPTDLPLVAALSAWGQVPIAERAARSLPAGAMEPQELAGSLRNHGYANLLVLEIALSDRQSAAIHAASEAHFGAPLRRSQWGAVYALPD